jgi:DNA-binding CsgD family transcriptional regulator
MRLGDPRLNLLRIGPLALVDFEQLLRAHLDVPLPRPVARRIFEATGGNPLFGLELGRQVIEGNQRVEAGTPLRIGGGLEAVIAKRLRALDPSARRALEVAAATANPTVDLLIAAGVQADGIDTVVSEGLLTVVDKRQISVNHPLYARGAYGALGPLARRKLHRTLTDLVDDADERARHLALSSSGPSSRVAAEVESAAERAAQRGNPETAAELFELAQELTPADEPLRRRRQVQAAINHCKSGGGPRTRELLQQVVDDAPHGRDRAEALYWLSLAAGDPHRIQTLVQQAASETFDDPKLEALIQTWKGNTQVWHGDVDAGTRDLRAALHAAERSGDERLIAMAAGDYAIYEMYAGRPTPWDLLRSAVDTELRIGLPPLTFSKQGDLGIALTAADRLDEAREVLEATIRRALQYGDEDLRDYACFWLSQLESRADRYAVALALADESVEHSRRQTAGDISQGLGASLYARALAGAYLGDAASARSDATEGLAIARAVDDRHYDLMNESVLGFVALSEGDVHTAVRYLRSIPDRLEAQGLREPTHCPFRATAIEALIGIGELDEATRLLAVYERRARAVDRASAIARALCCRGLLTAALGNPRAALTHFDAALDEHQRLPTRFEPARTRLALGTTLRRLKRKHDARVHLEYALAEFEAIGTRLWAERARAEITRIGGRRRSTGGLSATERQVAELVMAGRTNREVAAQLFISVRTVEANLSRIYAKLDVTSRAQLLSRYSGELPP